MEQQSGRLKRAARTIARMSEDRELLTLTKAADLTGYSTGRLREMARKEGLPAEKFGNTWVIERGDLVRYLEAHQPTRGRPRGAKNRRPRSTPRPAAE